jgi:hypothetical protein
LSSEEGKRRKGKEVKLFFLKNTGGILNMDQTFLLKRVWSLDYFSSSPPHLFFLSPYRPISPSGGFA